MFEMLQAIHLLLSRVVCWQRREGPKGTPFLWPPHEAQGSREAETAAGFDLLRQCVVK